VSGGTASTKSIQKLFASGVAGLTTPVIAAHLSFPAQTSRGVIGRVTPYAKFAMVLQVNHSAQKQLQAHTAPVSSPRDHACDLSTPGTRWVLDTTTPQSTTY
jgi:hypothetical protein